MPKSRNFYHVKITKTLVQPPTPLVKSWLPLCNPLPLNFAEFGAPVKFQGSLGKKCSSKQFCHH